MNSTSEDRKEMTKLFDIRGDKMRYGQVMFRLIEAGEAVAVYWPQGMDPYPSVIRGGGLKERCDAIKAQYGLVEVSQ